MSVVDKKALRHELYRKTIPRSYIALFVGIVLLFILLSYAFFGFYLEHWYTGPARTASRFLPLPAVIVESDIVWYREVAEFANVFAAAAEDEHFGITDPFRSAVDRAVSNAHLEHFAQELGVHISRSDIQDYAIEDPDLETFLEEIGWNESQYRTFIVGPLLQAQQAEEIVFSDQAYQAEALNRIGNVQQDLELGIAFEDLAKQYSDDVSGASGGYLGFFDVEQLPEGLDPLEEAALEEPSDVIETEGAFLVAQVYDVIEVGGERIQVAIQLIQVNKTGLSDALEAFSQTQTVRYFVR